MSTLAIELSTWVAEHIITALGILLGFLSTMFGALLAVGWWMIKSQAALATQVGTMAQNVKHLESEVGKHIDDKSIHVTSDRFDNLKERFDKFEGRIDGRFDKLEEMIRSRSMIKNDG